MDQTNENWTEKRVDQLEKRISNHEDRCGKRIDGVYWTVYWAMLLVFAAFYVAALVAATQA